MIRKASVLFVAVVAMVLGAATARAHHSVAAEFDVNKPLEFKGTIKKVDWTNPHIYTSVEAKSPDGKTVVYRVEGGPPNSLCSVFEAPGLYPGRSVYSRPCHANRPIFRSYRNRARPCAFM